MLIYGLVCVCLNNYHCQCMSVKDQISRDAVHSIIDCGTFVFVCARFNLYLYILLRILLSFHWLCVALIII